MIQKKSKKKALDGKKDNGDFVLSEKHYKQLKGFKIFSTEKRVAKIFGVKNRATGERFINLKSRSKRPFGWKFNYGISLYNTLHINNLFRGLRLVARTLGWSGLENAETNIEALKIQLRNKEELILELESANEEERTSHNELMEQFRKLQAEVLKSNSKNFRDDLSRLSKLIEEVKSRKIAESELQEFLFSHPWFFGTEYINAEPQKLRGAYSKFDFYLERFNKTKDIVEIKLLSDQIINKDKSISAKVIQAVDQLIGYMESSVAAAHSSVISKEEGIQELRPRGIVIIGSDDTEVAESKLKAWNYQLAHITILTYKDIAKKAESVLKHIEVERKD